MFDFFKITYSKFMKLCRKTEIIEILFIINLLGSIYGFYWYKDQLLKTPKIFWIFVPDSPMATFLFSISLYFFIIEKPKALFNFIACNWIIKYGLWAVIINIHYMFLQKQLLFTNLHLTLSHIGMAIEGMIFLHFTFIKKKYVIFTFLLMTLSDFVDYAFKLHPWLFDSSQLVLAQYAAVFLTLILSFYNFLRYKK